jgi:protein-arginine kinase activator protein McsA
MSWTKRAMDFDNDGNPIWRSERGIQGKQQDVCDNCGATSNYMMNASVGLACPNCYDILSD